MVNAKRGAAWKENEDSHKAHGPPLGQAILYISPVDALALY